MTREAGHKEKKAQKTNKKTNLRLQKIGSAEEIRDLRDSSFKALNEVVAAEADGKPSEKKITMKSVGTDF